MATFFKCNHCNQIVTLVKNVGVKPSCCGEQMVELIPGAIDGALEKHVPEFEISGNVVKVKVGAVEHPMTEAHLIEWVAIETNQGLAIKYLKAEQKPELSFVLAKDEKLVTVYAYCNLHGLWKKDI